MKNFILSILIIVQFIPFSNCQTTIKAGNISGVWTKDNSPYIITGDINIPFNQSLEIRPGVQIVFKDAYILNVQGSLNAIGTRKDTIMFTIEDTTGYHSNNSVGWNGIHFDKREIRWDTIKYLLPEGLSIDDISNIKKADTPEKVLISLLGEDLVNDVKFIDSKSLKESSKIKYCKFEYTTVNSRSRPYIFGGAIYIYRYRNLVISDSKFENCRAYSGGAIYCKEAAPAIVNNIFQKCNAVSSGGAMTFINSGPIVVQNLIRYNISGYNGGGIIFFESCPLIINNIIAKNIALNFGGGVFNENNTGLVLQMQEYNLSKNTKTFEYNSDRDEIEKLSVKNDYISNVRYYNNIISDNRANYGGGIGLYAVAPEMINNTISNNFAKSKGGAFYSFFSSPLIANSIIYGNVAAIEGEQFYLEGRTDLNISNSDIQSGVLGIVKDSLCTLNLIFDSNINTNPSFVDPVNMNYSLRKNSPCINTGKQDTTLIKLTSTDLYGNNRINGNIVDLGAIEYNPDIKPELKIASSEIRSDSDQDMIINIYPNPSNGEFILSILYNSFKSLKIIVLSASGAVIMNDEIDTESFVERTISLNNVPSGVYIIQLTAENQIIYKNRLIVK